VSSGHPHPPLVDVLIDGGCPMCRRTARMLRRADWLNRLEFVDTSNDDRRNAVAPGLARERALAAMHVRDRRSGQITSGYDACVRLARILPPLWVLVPLTYIPGIAVIGRRIYRLIAESRTRDGRCTDDICRPAAEPSERPARQHF
jgi:predicted DCC family thiol-disulfide oxidoreductase YuxK